MEGLLELFFTILLSVWENINTIATPILDIINLVATELITQLAGVLGFVLEMLTPIVEAIIKLIEFIGGLVPGG